MQHQQQRDWQRLALEQEKEIERLREKIKVFLSAQPKSAGVVSSKKCAISKLP
jgi:hypothetical protein